MLRELLSEDIIVIGLKADTWQEAIRGAGNVLRDTGKCNQNYVDAMVESVEKFGPYIVIDDGIAMPHAKSNGDVTKDGLAVVTLETPIDFGNEDFEPVSVMFAICSADSDSHLLFLQELASIFECDDIVNRIRSCNNKQEILELLKSAI